MTFAVFGYGIFWGTVDAATEAESIEVAAREWGTEGCTEGLKVVEVTAEQVMALGDWAADGQPADSCPIDV